MYEGMQALAEIAGWKLDPPHPGALHLYSSVTLTKEESGIPVRLERIGGAQLFTTLAFLEPPLPFSFAISNEGLIGALKHLVGIHDIEVGDAAFDKAFRIVSKDEAAVKKLLNAEVRASLTDLLHATNPLGMRGFQVSEHGASLTRVTDPFSLSPDQLVADVPVVIAVVQAMQKAR
jgi:hypothetical protein